MGTLCRVFIDGEAGTTGLGIRERLSSEPDFQVISIAPDKRKDPDARRQLMSEVDCVVLCLPDSAAQESVALADSLGDNSPKILDASTAYRTHPDWVYGFAEMTTEQSHAIKNAKRVSNPGCYPTGAIALLRPLITQGILSTDTPITINAVSGYSGGGKGMIEAYEGGKAPAFELYGLSLEHKHVPEIQLYSGLSARPLFVPSVGNFRQGMLVSIPLHLDALLHRPHAKDIHAALEQHFKGSDVVRVVPINGDQQTHNTHVGLAGGNVQTKIEPQALNDTNTMELCVFSHEMHRQAVLIARLDNLGKGASGAAVQNLKLMRAT